MFGCFTGSHFTNNRFNLLLEGQHITIDPKMAKKKLSFCIFSCNIIIVQQNIEILRMELELRRLRSSLGDLHERQTQRQQIEALKKELDVGNSYLVGLKYELSKTQVTIMKPPSCYIIL